jgi:uncharacterized protein (TIGR02599 family)
MKRDSMPPCFRRGFTLVEVLVSTVIILMILVVVMSLASQTSRIWRYTTSKVQEFSAARIAFEAITNRLSQSTLNTYWGYHYPGNDTTKSPDSYTRQSELRFITNFTATLAPNSTSPRPLHSIFFQAPLGYGENTASIGSLSGLNTLINTCGFYVEFNSDASLLPDFLNTVHTIKPHYRFRLMEYLEPSNALSVYNYTSGTSGANYAGRDWFADAFGPLGTAPVHVLAENVIALVLLPKFSTEQDPTGTSLAPYYAYDSANNVANSLNAVTMNQLPPVVQVTMVALDEASASRLEALNGTSMPSLFTAKQFTDASQFSTDLAALEKTLIQQKLNFRVFTTNVNIPAAKWEGN